MSDVVKILERELSQFEAELRSNPTFIKIERIRQLLDAYAGADGKPTSERPKQSKVTPALASAGTPTKRTKVYESVTEALRANGPMHRKDLLKLMMDRGLMGTEKNPMQAMAIYLSDAKDRFKSLGGGTWDLQTSTDLLSIHDSSSGAAMPPRSQG